jgi:hypothetical protein
MLSILRWTTVLLNSNLATVKTYWRQNLMRQRLASSLVFISLGLVAWPACAAFQSGVYQTLAGATVQERGDRVPNGSRVIPYCAALTFDLGGAQPSLAAVIPNAVLEGGDPFPLTVHSSFGAQLADGTYDFRGDYIQDTQYLFDWRFSVSPDGQITWNGSTFWAGGHWWQITISSLTVVPAARLAISRAGTTTVQLAWATNFSDHVLEFATNLSAAAWNTLTNTLTTNDTLSVTVDSAALQRFYRLRKP